MNQENKFIHLFINAIENSLAGMKDYLKEELIEEGTGKMTRKEMSRVVKAIRNDACAMLEHLNVDEDFDGMEFFKGAMWNLKNVSETREKLEFLRDKWLAPNGINGTLDKYSDNCNYMCIHGDNWSVSKTLTGVAYQVTFHDYIENDINGGKVKEQYTIPVCLPDKVVGAILTNRPIKLSETPQDLREYSSWFKEGNI